MANRRDRQPCLFEERRSETAILFHERKQKIKHNGECRLQQYCVLGLRQCVLRCVDCNAEFIWTAGEQLFFADKQFKNEPKRCKTCKAKRANRVTAGPTMRERVETQTSCSACGKDTTVPFRPTQGRPVFCKECFQQRKFAGAGGV